MILSEHRVFEDFWYPVGYSASLGRAPTAVEVLGRQYVLWRSDEGEGLHAAMDRCPHRMARLSQGWVEGSCLVCPYHGWRYGSDGTCETIPSAPRRLPVPPRARLEMVPVAERYGLVWLCPGEPSAGVPDLEEAEDPSFTVIHEMLEVWEASAFRIVDNALDVSHVPWTHRDSIGSSGSACLGELRLTRTGLDLRYSASYEVRVTDQLTAVAKIGRPETLSGTGLARRWTHATLISPFVYKGVLEYPDSGLRHVLFKTVTPLDDRRSLFCQFVARNDSPDASRREAIAELDRRIQAEDRRLLEQMPVDFPLDLAEEVHCKADRMTVEYRRLLADLVQGKAGPGSADEPSDLRRPWTAEPASQ